MGALGCGTLSYSAPEVLAKNYTSKCDLWSLGVVVFVLLVGYMPFSGKEKHQKEMIKQGKCNIKEDAWSKVSKPAFDFALKLLNVDPDKRLSAKQALDDEWITARATLRQRGSVNQGIVDSLIKFSRVSAFRRACMSVMAWSLTCEERAMVRDAFLELDVDRSGTITLEEFRQVLQRKFHIEDNAVLEAFRALDESGSEEIQYTEFLAAMVSSRIQLHDDLLAKAFRRFDMDNTEYISTENLKELLGETYDSAEVERLLAEADFNQDGQISYQEFIRYLKDGDAADEYVEVVDRVIDTQMSKEYLDVSLTANERWNQSFRERRMSRAVTYQSWSVRESNIWSAKNGVHPRGRCADRCCQVS